MNKEVLNRLRPYLPAHGRGIALEERIDALLLDSIDLVELLCGLDAEFGVSLTVEEFQSAATVEQLCTLIRDKNYALR